MGHGADQDRRPGGATGMKSDEENVRQLLELLGALLLMTDGSDKIEIPHAMAAEIVAILSALPEGKAGRPKQWTDETEIRAIFRMLDGAPVNAVAREIAEETGQPESSAGRRLRALKNSRRFKNLDAKGASFREVGGAKYPRILHSAAPVLLLICEGSRRVFPVMETLDVDR